MRKRPWLVEIPDNVSLDGTVLSWRAVAKSRFADPQSARLSLSESWRQRNQGWRLRNKETGEVQS